MESTVYSDLSRRVQRDCEAIVKEPVVKLLLMAECIYCGAHADGGEHWMPRTFGTFKNFEQLFDRLCADCNTALGNELDQELANTGTTALAKMHLGIEGRHKGEPSKNPFQYRVMGSESATTVRMDSPDGTHKVLGEFVKTPAGETRVTAARQLVFRKGDGAIVPVNFPRGYSVDLLKRLLKVRDVEGATLIEMYLESDESFEDEAPRRLVRDAVGPYKDVSVFGGIGEVPDAQLVHGYAAARPRIHPKLQLAGLRPPMRTSRPRGLTSRLRRHVQKTR